MNEVELKFLEIDTEAIRQKIILLGAKKVFDGVMKAAYLDNEAGDIKKTNRVVRIRTEGEKVVLAYKEPQESTFASSSKETEITVSDYDVTKALFAKLGFTPSREYEKHRESYKLEGYSFELDTIPGIPTFLELEATSEDAIIQICAKLELDITDGKDWNCFVVQDYYKDKS